MDLATLDTTALAEQGSTLELRHPATDAVLVDDAGTPLSITLAGADSDRFKKAERTTRNRRLAMQGRRQNHITAEQLEEDALTSLAAATLSWRGIVLDGQPLECTPQNAVKLYRRLPWIREQVDMFVGDRAAFLKTSPST